MNHQPAFPTFVAPPEQRAYGMTSNNDWNQHGWSPGRVRPHPTPNSNGAAYIPPGPEANNQANKPDVPNPAGADSETIAVRVPEGVNPGDPIMVATPDGTSVIEAIVPPNVFAGSTFFMQVPLPEHNQTPILVKGVPHEEDIDSVFGGISATPVIVRGEDVPHEATQQQRPPIPVQAPPPPQPQPVQAHQPVQQPTAHPRAPQPSQGESRAPPPMAMASLDPSPFPNTISLPVSRRSQNYRHQGQQSPQRVQSRAAPQPIPPPSSDQILLVQVPPGTPTGSLIQVQVPDGRFIGATVPAGSPSEFYMRVPPPRPPTTWATAPPQSPNHTAAAVAVPVSPIYY